MFTHSNNLTLMFMPLPFIFRLVAGRSASTCPRCHTCTSRVVHPKPHQSVTYFLALLGDIIAKAFVILLGKLFMYIMSHAFWHGLLSSPFLIIRNIRRSWWSCGSLRPPIVGKVVLILSTSPSRIELPDSSRRTRRGWKGIHAAFKEKDGIFLPKRWPQSGPRFRGARHSPSSFWSSSECSMPKTALSWPRPEATGSPGRGGGGRAGSFGLSPDQAPAARWRPPH